jgi:hypothetical protein
MIGACGATDPSRKIGHGRQITFCILFLASVPNCLETRLTSVYIRFITALDLACGMSGD